MQHFDYFDDDHNGQYKENLELMTRKLFEAYKNWSLAQNYKKYIYILDEKKKICLNIGELFDSYEEYIYLGTKTEKIGRTEQGNRIDKEQEKNSTHSYNSNFKSI